MEYKEFYFKGKSSTHSIIVSESKLKLTTYLKKGEHCSSDKEDHGYWNPEVLENKIIEFKLSIEQLGKYKQKQDHIIYAVKHLKTCLCSSKSWIR